MQDELRYLTDDRDQRQRNELVIMQGGNGDWYVAVVPEGTGTMGRAARICTSGGAASAAPGLPAAMADAYRAMKAAGEGRPAEAGAAAGQSECDFVEPVTDLQHVVAWLARRDTSVTINDGDEDCWWANSMWVRGCRGDTMIQAVLAAVVLERTD